MKKFSKKLFTTACLFTLGSQIAFAENKLEISGLIELEGSYQETVAAKQNNAALNLATVEIGLAQQINKNISANVLLLHEDGEAFGIDEGTLHMNHIDVIPLGLTAGKMYLPFGKFDSAFIADSLPLELAETNKNAVEVGFQHSGFETGFFAFTGSDEDITAASSRKQKFGARASYNNDLIEAGVSYLHSMANLDSINNPDEDAMVNNSVAGLALNTALHISDIDFIAEYITALSAFEANSAVTGTQKAQPAAYQLEMVYNFRKLQFMAGYQGSSDAQALGLSEKRMLVGSAIALQDSTNLAIQFARDTQYAVGDAAAENQFSFTTQISVEF